MNTGQLPIGSFVRINKQDLQAIVDKLRELGYRTIGPQIAESAIVYDELESVSQMPIGWLDDQDGGTYRLHQLEDADQEAYFDYVVGPHSLKNYVFPARDTILEGVRADGTWQLRACDPPQQRLAVIGPRSCDLHGLEIQDRVFLQGDFVDPNYQARRSNLFIAAVNCRRAAATCFCHSMRTGPAVSSGCDLALTELDDCFVIEVGTELGGKVVTAAEWIPCPMDDIQAATELPKTLERSMRRRSSNKEASDEQQPVGRKLETKDIHDLLMNNLEHPRWNEVAERCLACANCTMVCPTCFCSSVEEVPNLTGDHVFRQRSWASCFTAEHSYMNSGTVRKTTHLQYRQWLTHKLATWIDQYGTSGCTGCGRCITWCPVGIDLTEEVAAIRGET